MKKGLITLAMLAILSATAFAKAPTIGSIPDIVIVDADDPDQQAALTVDLNFFRYMNAFNVMTYVSDEDTDAANLQFSFREATTSEDISVNGVTQLGAGDTAAAPPTGKQIQAAAGGYWFSFRDLIRSPEAGSTPFPNPVLADSTEVPSGTVAALPWRNTEGSSDLSGTSRLVTLWVTDQETDPASKSFSVISINSGEADALSGGAAFEDLFTGTLTDLGTSTGDGFFYYSDLLTGSELTGLTDLVNLGTKGTTGGLSITTPLANGGKAWFGRWVLGNVNAFTESIPVADGNVLYGAMFKVKHNNTLRGTNPMMRLGVNNATNQISILSLIDTFQAGAAQDADGNPQWPDTDVEKWFPLCWENFSNLVGWENLDDTAPFDSRAMGATWDVLDTKDATGGTLTLTGFKVVTTARPDTLDAADANRTDIDALTSAAGFGFTDVSPLDNPNPATGVYTAAANGTTGAWDVAIAGSSAGHWYLWEAPAATAIDWTDQLARFSLYLSCPSETDRQGFNRFRIRISNTGFLGQEFIVRQSTNAGATIVAAPGVYGGSLAEDMRYTTYIPGLGGPSSLITSNNFDQIFWNVDLFHNLGGPGAEAATNISLHKAIVEDRKSVV